MVEFEKIAQNFAYLFLPALAVLFFFFLFWNIMLQRKISKINKRNEEFYAGGKVHNLEELLVDQAKTLKSLDRDIQELYNISNSINTLSLRGLSKVGMVRFNPFKDVGGNQSFAIALLNGKNNGLTLSSLYTREGTRIYAKAITDSQSEEHPLTNEEKQAIEIAIGKK